MAVAIITGSGGLVGSEAVRLFAKRGLKVVGIDNAMRGYFFGEEACTKWQIEAIKQNIKTYTHFDTDIRNTAVINQIFATYGSDIKVVIHCAAQPSHDWAARKPITDFTINANGTLNLLEAARQYSPEAAFIFVSTNKVYGDRPNHFPIVEGDTRFELSPQCAWAEDGFSEDLPIDNCLHSLFGASKIAADIMVQEYGRYFGMKTSCFRGGCLTGPNHSGAQLHGFLSYLMKCAMEGKTYTVFGHKGKQVRDNIHVRDLVEAFWCFFQNPGSGQVFNIGGGRRSNCSVLEAISIAEEMTGRPMSWTYDCASRTGDHIWWISDVSLFQGTYPEWTPRYGIRDIMADIHAGLVERAA